MYQPGVHGGLLLLLNPHSSAQRAGGEGKRGEKKGGGGRREEKGGEGRRVEKGGGGKRREEGEEKGEKGRRGEKGEEEGRRGVRGEDKGGGGRREKTSKLDIHPTCELMEMWAVRNVLLVCGAVRIMERIWNKKRQPVSGPGVWTRNAPLGRLKGKISIPDLRPDLEPKTGSQEERTGALIQTY